MKPQTWLLIYNSFSQVENSVDRLFICRIRLLGFKAVREVLGLINTGFILYENDNSIFFCNGGGARTDHFVDCFYNSSNARRVTINKFYIFILLLSILFWRVLPINNFLLLSFNFVSNKIFSSFSCHNKEIILREERSFLNLFIMRNRQYTVLQHGNFFEDHWPLLASKYILFQSDVFLAKYLKDNNINYEILNSSFNKLIFHDPHEISVYICANSSYLCDSKAYRKDIMDIAIKEDLTIIVHPSDQHFLHLLKKYKFKYIVGIKDLKAISKAYIDISTVFELLSPDIPLYVTDMSKHFYDIRNLEIV